ncbi:hypothetical protein BIW11_13218, partial [Tropilaelaps mercedesae]
SEVTITSLAKAVRSSTVDERARSDFTASKKLLDIEVVMAPADDDEREHHSQGTATVDTDDGQVRELLNKAKKKRPTG